MSHDLSCGAIAPCECGVVAFFTVEGVYQSYSGEEKHTVSSRNQSETFGAFMPLAAERGPKSAARPIHTHARIDGLAAAMRNFHFAVAIEI